MPDNRQHGVPNHRSIPLPPVVNSFADCGQPGCRQRSKWLAANGQFQIAVDIAPTSQGQSAFVQTLHSTAGTHRIQDPDSDFAFALPVS